MWSETYRMVWTQNDIMSGLFLLFLRKFWAGPCRAFWPLPKSLCWWRPKARCLWFVTQVSRFRARLEPAEPPSQRQEIRPGFQRTDFPPGVTAFPFSALLSIFRTKNKEKSFQIILRPNVIIALFLFPRRATKCSSISTWLLPRPPEESYIALLLTAPGRSKNIEN